MENEDDRLRERVLVLAPTVKDAETTARLLERVQISTCLCENMGVLCNEAQRGAAAALMTEEVIVNNNTGELHRLLGGQPSWSDFPLLVMARPGVTERSSFPLLAAYRNFTLIERPVSMPVLLVAVQNALRDRRRQYSLRDQIGALERTDKALRDADRRKDEFLAMLGHELRNPLAAISSAVHLLNRPSVSSEVRLTASESLSRQVNLLSRLIDDLLDVGRINTGKVRLKTEPVDLRRVAALAVNVIQPAVDAAGHTLEVELGDSELWVMADPARIEQVLTNILTNAIKYTKNSGRIQMCADLHPGYARITLSDNGIGIPPDLLPHIFDLFTQGEATLARSQGGLGIGLTLVKRLVQLHDGRVAAHSDGLGLGSTFTVELPAITKPALSTDAAAASEHHTRHRKILVVDDNRDAARNLALLLKDRGHEVRVAFNGLEAIEQARQFFPEVALLDIGLPDLSGYDLAPRLTETPGLESLTLIAISGYSKSRDRKLSKLAGFEHHLVKPVNTEQLLTLVG